MSKNNRKRGLWYLFLAPFAFLGLITVEVSPQDARKHPRAKWLGILMVPAVFAGVALFMWGKSEGVWEDLGLTRQVYDVSEGGACTDLTAVFSTPDGSAASNVTFYPTGRTEIWIDHFDGGDGLSLSLVMQADPDATIDDDMVAQVRFAELFWTVSLDDIMGGLLEDDRFWNRPEPKLRDVSKILNRKMSKQDFAGDAVQIGFTEINQADVWLTAPMVLWRGGGDGAYTYDVRGLIPRDEIGDALRVFSSDKGAKGRLMVMRGDSAQLVAARDMQGADLGGVMREAIDAMLAQWQAGVPEDC